MEGEKVGGNGERYFEARAWESIDRRFEGLERSQRDTADALGRLATVSESNAQRVDAYLQRQRNFWRSWRVVIAAVISFAGVVLLPLLTFLHSIRAFGWR